MRKIRDGAQAKLATISRLSITLPEFSRGEKRGNIDRRVVHDAVWLFPAIVLNAVGQRMIRRRKYYAVMTRSHRAIAMSLSVSARRSRPTALGPGLDPTRLHVKIRQIRNSYTTRRLALCRRAMHATSPRRSHAMRDPSPVDAALEH